MPDIANRFFDGQAFEFAIKVQAVKRQQIGERNPDNDRQLIDDFPYRHRKDAADHQDGEQGSWSGCENDTDLFGFDVRGRSCYWQG
jgi:hypothetical protein